MHIVISCEHASGAIPHFMADSIRAVFEPAMLNTHIAYDLFAAPAARSLARRFKGKAHTGRWSRLCIDLNRSARNPACFKLDRSMLTDAQKRRLYAYHSNYRSRLLAEVKAAPGFVLHLSVHSFTPILKGEIRNCDVGILYDPQRTTERNLALRWQIDLKHAFRVRRNYPYRGTDDGITTWLRSRLAEKKYAGIELELNQALGGDVIKVVDCLFPFDSALEDLSHTIIPGGSRL
jgi:predicted N-formylglutamate amidohydrolase